MWQDTKRVFWIALMGAVMGAYGLHQIEASPLIKLVIGGACTQPGIQTVSLNFVLYYNCQDTVIANHIQTADMDASAQDDLNRLVERTEETATKKKGKKK